MNSKVLHRFLRGIANLALHSFFTEVRVIGSENVPRNGPIIAAATHHNMMLDPVILSCTFPYKRMLNYWSKASLFKNPVMKWILLSSGNIPVDRKSKDRQVLFKGTFDALSRGEAVAVFPEGTSYTEPRIMQVKDGVAWASLEYCKWRQLNPGKGHDEDVKIIPVAIVYTNKSKYRSCVIIEFGKPITMDPYKDHFLSPTEGASRAAVKRVTHQLAMQLFEMTVNAPDWDTLYAARMARDIMWEGERALDLDHFVAVSQTLVDLFATPNSTGNAVSVKRRLLEYYSLLQSTRLSNSVLSALPLPRTLDPKSSATLPSRLYTLAILLRDSLSSLARLPFFLFPLIVHAPVYVMGRLGARMVKDEEETQAQNKVAFGFLSLLLVYPTAFFFLWALFLYTRTGAILAFVTVALFARYHNQMINDNYEHAKRLIATWRVLIGVWAPKRWEYPLANLTQYTTPAIPKPSEWVTRRPSPSPSSSPNPGNSTSPAPQGRNATSPASASSSSSLIPPQLPPDLQLGTDIEPPVKSRTRRPPSRRIMRHVLRARIEAVRALASLFEQLEREPSKRLRASAHLAKAYGGLVEESKGAEIKADGTSASASEDVLALPEGWRTAREVIDYLRARGGKIPRLGGAEREEGEWAAALSSDGETNYSGTATADEELEWVPSSA
ncbi:uncharacterized protein SCHCODRAFT_02510249 [Schizophyllum commune H4-8]|uniref:uncharacterized protein n=1 Tax=Schizophyllum commune (strain H4-8 / FGSC 9210) TaxID=578458 RepID=UPI0021606384|nr:uncharacterized protein SCHCODRAFT_02510249 [Schizophyllum commune H4-8]KAI5889222.1 hypothetical protein SCHCODRAFT_02510249 [Schizophyllum commune H4-8]